MSDTSGKASRRRVITVPAVIAVSIVLLLWGLQYVIFPKGSYFREIIAKANRVELRAFVENNEAGGIDVAVIEDPNDIRILADSIQLRGIWLPFDELIGNSYRIRAIRGQEMTDIVIRGGYRIKDGNWFVGVSSSLMETFVYLVEKSGGTMPSVRELTRR